MQVATTFLDKGKKVFVVDLNPFKGVGKDVNEIGWEPIYKHYKQNTEELNWNTAMEILTNN